MCVCVLFSSFLSNVILSVVGIVAPATYRIATLWGDIYSILGSQLTPIWIENWARFLCDVLLNLIHNQIKAFRRLFVARKSAVSPFVRHLCAAVVFFFLVMLLFKYAQIRIQVEFANDWAQWIDNLQCEFFEFWIVITHGYRS